IVLQIELMAHGTAHSIEALAREVPRLVAGAIATVRAAIGQASGELATETKKQMDQIRAHEEQIDTHAEDTRNNLMNEMHTRLLNSSQTLQKADKELQAAFAGKDLEEASKAIIAVPEGAFHLIELPPLPGESDEGPDTDKKPAKPPANEKEARRRGIHDVPSAAQVIDQELRDKKGKDRLGIWQDWVCANAAPPIVAQQ